MSYCSYFKLLVGIKKLSKFISYISITRSINSSLFLLTFLILHHTHSNYLSSFFPSISLSFTIQCYFRSIGLSVWRDSCVNVICILKRLIFDMNAKNFNFAFLLFFQISNHRLRPTTSISVDAWRLVSRDYPRSFHNNRQFWKRSNRRGNLLGVVDKWRHAN